MSQFKARCLAAVVGIAVALLPCTAVRCEESKNAPTINIKSNPEGLVVIVNSNQSSLDAVNFSCNQGKNEIVVALPAENTRPIIDGLQTNSHVTPGGVSASPLPQRGMKQIRIVPKLKLYCADIQLVSKFQRYVTYLYPAGKDLHLTEAGVSGFDFDDNLPRAQVVGAITLKFDKPLGGEPADVVSTEESSLKLRLNPKDFVTQGKLATLFPAKGLSVATDSSEAAGLHIFKFQTINDATIGRVKARATRGPGGDELRIDLTLAVSLYETGKKFYENGNSRRALLYLDAAKNEPASALVSRMSMGTILWNDDNYTDAAKSFRELIDLDRTWEFPEARYYAAKAYYLANNRLGFDLADMLKQFLRRCDRGKFQTCGDARELFDQVNEPALKLNVASKPELKKLTARLADPKQNYNEVQKNIFHYWATWCPVCLEEMPRIMKYAVDHPNVAIYIVAKNDNQKNIFNALIKAGAIKRKNIQYYIDTKDDIMLRQMVPLILASKEPVTPLPISVFLQRETPFYLTDRLGWGDGEISQIWKMKYQE